MKVRIKSFDVEMQVKAKGIEFEVRSADDAEQLGDCYLTMTGLTWCAGKTTKDYGVKISWQDFRDICASDVSVKKAVKAAHEKA